MRGDLRAMEQIRRTAERESVMESLPTDKMRFTGLGGLAILLTAGENLVCGNVVHVTAANTVSKILQNAPDPIGAVYADALNGTAVWVVVAGVAYVYFIGNTTAGQIARGFVTADAGFVAGQALAEAVPGSPFATDKHFYEIGHVLEARTGAGLAKCILHFN